MTEQEKAFAGYFYDATNPVMREGLLRSQHLCREYNSLDPADTAAREKLIRENMRSVGIAPVIEQPFFCDFWERITVGDHFYSNYNVTMLAGNYITFGNNVLIATNCGFYAAGHPFDIPMRRKGIEYALPIVVGDDVWIGGSVSVIGGVTIGNGSVIGAGSVVISDIPDHVLAAGNPCRVIREILPGDDARYYPPEG